LGYEPVTHLQLACQSAMDVSGSLAPFINPDPTKNDPAVSRQDWTLHGFATQWRVLLLELVRGLILAQRRKGSKGKRGGALANLAPWREESFPAPPMVGSDLAELRNGFQCQ
jgi:hypothetical protein